jgi:hypothetical protein
MKTRPKLNGLLTLATEEQLVAIYNAYVRNNSIFICHASPGFSSLWDTKKLEIKQLAENFIKSKRLKHIRAFSGNGSESCLFYLDTFDFDEKTLRLSFLTWWLEKIRKPRNRTKSQQPEALNPAY